MGYRKRAPRRKAPRRARQRRRVPRSLSSGTGGMVVTRKCPLVFVRNQLIAGSAVTNGVVNGNITLGTPEVNPYSTLNVCNVPFTCNFSLSQLLSVTDFTNLFDRYKILGVSISVKYNCNSTDGVGPQFATPAINWVNDYDDSGNVTVPAIRQRQGIKRKVFNGGNLIKMSCKPKCSALLYQSALVNAYAIEPPKWIDCDYITTPHFGLRGYIEDMNLTSTSSIDTMFTFDISLRVAFKDVL